MSFYVASSRHTTRAHMIIIITKDVHACVVCVCVTAFIITTRTARAKLVWKFHHQLDKMRISSHVGWCWCV